jgi:hypothetical protein
MNAETPRRREDQIQGPYPRPVFVSCSSRLLGVSAFILSLIDRGAIARVLAFVPY